jgi:sugar fermentation stimulation protein A
MDFPSPLVRGQLIHRYKRFLADVELSGGSLVTVHVANPGAMLGLATPGSPVWLSDSGNPKRKLRYSWELVELGEGTGVACVNTHLANRLVAEALAAGAIPELAGYPTIRPEVRYGDASRVDFLLTDPARPPLWLEVKSVTLSRRAGLAEWPDCVSARAVRHLSELQQLAARGERAAVLFVVQISGCDTVTVAHDLDPAFATAMGKAVAAGVEVLAYSCEMTTSAIKLVRKLDWRP